jgi:hypothetical protein
MEFLISSLGGIPLGIKNRIDVEFPTYPGEFPGYKGLGSFEIIYSSVTRFFELQEENWIDNLYIHSFSILK